MNRPTKQGIIQDATAWADKMALDKGRVYAVYYEEPDTYTVSEYYSFDDREVIYITQEIDL